MKKNIFILVFAGVLFAGCAEKTLDSEPSLKEFTAFSEMTKTVLDGLSVKWLSTDEIGVFASAGVSACFSAMEILDNGAAATFSGNCESATTYYAVYPYNAEYSLTADGKILASIPENQTFTASSFSDGANLAVAKSTGSQFHFNNVGAILAFRVTAEDVASVKFTADVPVAGGSASIDYNEGDPTVSVTGGSTSVSMTGDFVSDSTYYFAVYPGTYGSFSLTFTTSDGKSTTLTNTTETVISRNSNLLLNNFNLVLTPSINVKGTSTFAGSAEGITFSTNDLGDEAEYNWVFEGGTPATSTDRTVTVIYDTKGKYDVSLSVRKGAKSGKTEKEELVSVYPGNPLLFLPFDGDYLDHSENGIAVDPIDAAAAEEKLGFAQPGHTGVANSSAYFPGFSNTKYSVLSISDETFGSLFNSSGNFTISMWVKPRNTKAAAGYFFSQGTGDIAKGWHYMRLDNQVNATGGKYRFFYQLRYTNQVNDDNSISFKYNYDAATQANLDMRDGNWHHIVTRVMVEGTDTKKMSWKMFIDGKEYVKNAQAVKTLDSYIPFVIGAKYVESTKVYGDPYKGNIDDLIIWNRTIGNDDMKAFSSY